MVGHHYRKKKKVKKKKIYIYIYIYKREKGGRTILSFRIAKKQNKKQNEIWTYTLGNLCICMACGHVWYAGLSRINFVLRLGLI